MKYIKSTLALCACLALVVAACDTSGVSSETSTGDQDIAGAKPQEVKVCHVGNEVGVDAGLIDLIIVSEKAAQNHIDNPSHTWDGQLDYYPEDVGASGEGSEDSNGDGVDDGCEIPVVTACFIDATYASGSFNLVVNLATGEFTSADPCPWFNGACSVSGTATPPGVANLSEFTGLTYIETNTDADQIGGGCDDSPDVDAFVSTLSRIVGTDEFSGTFTQNCDGSPSPPGQVYPFPSSFLQEGPCVDVSSKAQSDVELREKGSSVTQ